MIRSLTRSKSENVKLNPKYREDSYGRYYEVVETSEGRVLNKSGIDLDLYQLGKKGEINPEDLKDKIESVIDSLGEGNHTLYERTWNRINEDYWLNNLTVVQYTILPEYFYTNSETKPPFPCLLSYDSILKLLPDKVEVSYLENRWEIRKWRILEEIMRILKDSSGIIGINEMDNFYNFFYPTLKILGYAGVFVPKSKSLGLVSGWYSEGCALFWNQRNFKLKSLETGNYQGSNGIYLKVQLENRRTYSQLVVVVTNLNSDQQVEKLLELTGDNQYPTIILVDSISVKTINNLVGNHFLRLSGGKNNSILYRQVNLISNLTIPDINLDNLPNNRYPSRKVSLASKLSY